MQFDRDSLEALKEQVSALHLGEQLTTPVDPLEAFAAIPSRVQCNIPIQVAISKLPGAGRGLVVLKDVEAGQMVFKIENPLFTVVENGKVALANTCDNCFAAKHDETGVTTTEQESRFRVCSRCKVLHYCGKACQKEAWEHHHKYECSTLKKMQKWESDEYKLVYMSYVRLMVRLLERQLMGDIPTEEWAEIRSLKTNKGVRKLDAEGMQAAKLICEGLMHFTSTDLQYQEVQNNALAMSIPLLRPHEGNRYTPDAPPSIKAGSAMDPFMAMMNHSCLPNVSWFFEGRQLRLITTKPIKSGNELYITYIDDTGDYHCRRSLLREKWYFDCACDLCKQGPQGLSSKKAGTLGRRILDLKKAGWADIVEKLEEHKRAFEAFKAAGYGPGVYPSRWFYRCLWASHTMQGQWEEALKIGLKIYYEVEPLAKPAIDLEARVDTLYHLIYLIQEHPPKGVLDKEIISLIVTHLRGIHLRGVEKCFGRDTRIFQHKDVLEVACRRNSECEKAMQEGLKVLLDWAGVEQKEQVIL